jgi:hypothetical protein
MLSKTTLEDDEPLFISLNLECFRLGGKKSTKTEMARIIEPYITALIGASGISRHQAKTCFYYTVATFLISELLLMPILANWCIGYRQVKAFSSTRENGQPAETNRC